MLLSRLSISFFIYETKKKLTLTLDRSVLAITSRGGVIVLVEHVNILELTVCQCPGAQPAAGKQYIVMARVFNSPVLHRLQSQTATTRIIIRALAFSSRYYNSELVHIIFD